MTTTPLGNHLTTNSNSPSLLQLSRTSQRAVPLNWDNMTHISSSEAKWQHNDFPAHWRGKKRDKYFIIIDPIICDLSITSDFEGVSSPLDKSQWPQYVSADTWNTPETISLSDNNEIQNRFSMRTGKMLYILGFTIE